MIKKGLFTVEAKFWWSLIRYRLISTFLDNTLTWKRAPMVTSLMAGYDVYFSFILRHELYDRAFGELTNLPFPHMIKRLCNKVRVPELSGINERVPIIVTTWTRTIKDLAPFGASRRSRQHAAVP